MKTSDSPSAQSNEQQPDWKEVLFEVVIKILTLGFYHIKKHKG
jgi:hypothetical protein